MDKSIWFLLDSVGEFISPLEWWIKISTWLHSLTAPMVHSEMLHIIAHLIIYAALSMLVLRIFKLRLKFMNALLLAGIILLAGLGQEALQLQVKGRDFGEAEFFDLVVDLTGGAYGWLVTAYLRRYGRYFHIAYRILREA